MSRFTVRNSVVMPDSPSQTESGEYVLKRRARQRLLQAYVHVNERKQLGSGHYGTVTQGIWKSNGSEVAVKEIDKAKYSSLVALRNEVRIMQTVKHPNIINLVDMFETEQHMYLVTEICPGGELFDRIVELKSLSEVEACRIMQQSLQALKHVHNKHIAHRDLKPENILRTATGADYSLKMIDFGLSTVVPPGGRESGRVGTPYYIAPEVLAKDYDKSCDMWSMGVILFILLCGYPPFWGDVDRKIFARIKKGQYSMVGPQWANVSNSAKNLVKRLLCPEDSRLTVQDALDDIWMLEEGEVNHGKFARQHIQKLRRFSCQHPLKRAAIRIIAGRLDEHFVASATQVFGLFDLNRDGLVTESDIEEAALLCGAKMQHGDAQRIVDACQVRHPAALAASDFIPALLTKAVYLRGELVLTAFNTLDTTGGGFLSAASLQMHVGKQEAQRMQATCEQPQHGLSLKEFLRIMAGNEK